jgi:aspartate 4-decarboxylase
MLNAGRGNPNFLATTPRHGFFQFGLFAMTESERSYIYMEGVGGFPQREGIEARFEIFAKAHAGEPGVRFIEAAVSYVRDQLGLSAGDFIYEMCEAILGCNYPVPDRMLRLSEIIVGQYIHKEMIGTHPFVGKFDMYAVEGGTAAMTYLFNSLRENHLLAARRHHRAGHADLHAVHRDSAPQRLPADRGADRRAAREQLAVHQEGAAEAARPEGQGLLSCATRATRPR